MTELHVHDSRLSSLFTTQTTSLHVVPTVDVTLSSQGWNSTPHESVRNRLEDRNLCRSARAQTSHSAIDTLRRCLSSENLALVDPFIYSPTVIRSLYYRAESRSQLGMLNSEMLTRLMGIFGSLSIDPHASVAYRVPLPLRLLKVSTPRNHWTFVLKVGRYKSERGMPLHDSDRFWLMRAELAVAQAKARLEVLSADAYSAILRARTHYHIIRRHSRHPEVHAHYLESLLATRDPRLLSFAARDLSFLLRTQRVCSSRLQRLLYLLVIEHGNSLPSQSQEAILAALWSRACQESDGTVPENSQSDMAMDRYKLDATTTARSLSATLFGWASHLPFADQCSYLFSAFSPAFPLPLRWSSLILLSVFNSSESPPAGTWTSDHASLATSCWQVTFGLAILEKKFQQPSSSLAIKPVSTDDVLKTTRHLYRLWLHIAQSHPVSRDLACAIATSFLKMATILSDATLFHDCQSLYRVESSSEGPPTLVQRQFAAQYTAAAVRVRGALSGTVLPILENFSLDLDQRCQVTASTVEVLAPMDALLAYTLYNIAKENGMEPDSGATHTLAVSLAQSGALRQTVDFLNHGQFPLEKREILLATIARSLRDSPRTRHPSAVYVAIVDEVAVLYQSRDPPEHFRGHLEQLFVALARHGRGSQLFPIVISIFGRSSSFFQPRFFYQYCRVLMQHRQFTTASKLLDAIRVIHPKVSRSLSILADRTGIQARVSRAFTRISPLRGPASLGLASRLLRCPCSGPLLERSLRELLRSGRVRAAERILACVMPTLPFKQCTTLGNILLHGVSRQPSPRNGRRVRKVLALLENLVQDHNFQPDRVTVNVLVRALIDWRSAFDSPRLRELFDQLVRGGYPAAEYSALHPPFGTRQTSSLGSASFSKLPSFVSFEKHARPLFKMFIKAFYLRNDVEAARKVVGILKVEEHKNAVAREARRSARSRGRVKAAHRNASSSP